MTQVVILSRRRAGIERLRLRGAGEESPVRCTEKIASRKRRASRFLVAGDAGDNLGDPSGLQDSKGSEDRGDGPRDDIVIGTTRPRVAALAGPDHLALLAFRADGVPDSAFLRHPGGSRGPGTCSGRPPGFRLSPEGRVWPDPGVSRGPNGGRAQRQRSRELPPSRELDCLAVLSFRAGGALRSPLWIHRQSLNSVSPSGVEALAGDVGWTRSVPCPGPRARSRNWDPVYAILRAARGTRPGRPLCRRGLTPRGVPPRCAAEDEEACVQGKLAREVDRQGSSG